MEVILEYNAQVIILKLILNGTPLCVHGPRKSSCEPSSPPAPEGPVFRPKGNLGPELVPLGALIGEMVREFVLLPGHREAEALATDQSQTKVDAHVGVVGVRVGGGTRRPLAPRAEVHAVERTSGGSAVEGLQPR